MSQRQRIQESVLLTDKKRLLSVNNGSVAHTRTQSVNMQATIGFSSIKPSERFIQSQVVTPLLQASKYTEVDTHVEKAEVVALAKLKEKIEYMRNRLRYIEVSKVKNKGKIETMKRKADEILTVRNAIEEMNRQKIEFREQKQVLQNELHEKVGEAKVEKERGLEEAKEELRLDKVTEGLRTKDLKVETKKQRLAREAENLQRGKTMISLVHKKGTIAEAKGEKQFFRDGSQSCRSVTSKKDGLFNGKDVAFMERFEEYGIEDMQQQLEQLLQEEQRRAEDLRKVTSLKSQAKQDLLAVARSKIF